MPRLVQYYQVGFFCVCWGGGGGGRGGGGKFPQRFVGDDMMVYNND